MNTIDFIVAGIVVDRMNTYPIINWPLPWFAGDFALFWLQSGIALEHDSMRFKEAWQKTRCINVEADIRDFKYTWMHEEHRISDRQGPRAKRIPSQKNWMMSNGRKKFRKEIVKLSAERNRTMLQVRRANDSARKSKVTRACTTNNTRIIYIGI